MWDIVQVLALLFAHPVPGKPECCTAKSISFSKSIIGNVFDALVWAVPKVYSCEQQATSNLMLNEWFILSRFFPMKEFGLVHHARVYGDNVLVARTRPCEPLAERQQSV